MSDNSRYTLIKGNFHIFYPDSPKQGPEPDGDTITFEPNNIELINSFNKRKPDLNQRNIAKIRFEGVDALETHFLFSHQRLDFAYKARDYMLASLGFENIIYWDIDRLHNKVKSVNKNPRPGYILANEIDSYGRVIAFVFPDDINETDGANYFIDSSILKKSINYKMIQEALVYPALYTTMPLDLAKIIAEETRSARAKIAGIFQIEDVNTKKSATINGVKALQKMCMWPKLFRRLVAFYDKGYSHLIDFKPWLRENPVERDDKLLLPNGEIGNMHDLFSVSDNSIQLNYEPEDIIILPDNIP